MAQRRRPSCRSDHTVPYRTELVFPVTRHFVPGYLYLVPAGQTIALHDYSSTTSVRGDEHATENPGYVVLGKSPSSNG
jgi:hypothetical protein